jgi:hypothetical protein
MAHAQLRISVVKALRQCHLAALLRIRYNVNSQHGEFLPRTDSIRSELQRMVRSTPFRRFVLSLENGERAVIENPENIAFDPEANGSEDFYVISGRVRLFSTLGAVSDVYLADRNGAAA